MSFFSHSQMPPAAMEELGFVIKRQELEMWMKQENQVEIEEVD